MSSRRQSEPRTRASLLADLHRVGREHSDATVIFHGTIASRLGINATDEKTMSLLEREGPLTAGDIAHKTGLASASVTALLDRLEARHFVRRRRDPADRRRVIVEADPAGVRQFAPYFRGSREAVEAIYAYFDEDGLAAILKFMTLNAARLREATARIEAQ